MTLRDVSVGQTVKVTRLNGDGPVKRRIMDMGITKGVEVYVRKVAPLGDPVEVTVRGYELSLIHIFKDFKFIQEHFASVEKRDPSMTEIRVLDTYWSDHCRHTTLAKCS